MVSAPLVHLSFSIFPSHENKFSFTVQTSDSPGGFHVFMACTGISVVCVCFDGENNLFCRVFFFLGSPHCGRDLMILMSSSGRSGGKSFDASHFLTETLQSFSNLQPMRHPRPD